MAKIRLFSVWVHNGREWILKSVQETAAKAEAARLWFIDGGCRTGNVKVTQE